MNEDEFRATGKAAPEAAQASPDAADGTAIGDGNGGGASEQEAAGDGTVEQYPALPPNACPCLRLFYPPEELTAAGQSYTTGAIARPIN